MKEQLETNINNKAEILKVPEFFSGKELGAEILSDLLRSEKLPPKLAESNEETLFWLALTFEHPEREDKIFSLIKKHKEFVDNPRELQIELISLLSQEKQNKIEDTDNFDQHDVDQLESRTKEIIKYFKPKVTTSSITKVHVVKSDSIVGEQSGFSIKLGDEMLIFSHSKNPDNFDHEFMHGFVNPIIEKLQLKLTEEQKNSIIEMASEKYKKKDEYGEDWFSLLTEEIIRVYNIYIKNKESFIEEEDNRLRALVYDLYSQYENETNSNTSLCFEDFLFDSIPDRLG